MFNGTKTRQPGEFDRVMESERRQQQRVRRARDVTVYQDWFPASALELIFDLESDRMRNLDFDPKVGRERARRRLLRAALVGSTTTTSARWRSRCRRPRYVAHPYQIPTLGWPSDIEGWTIDDLRSYYQRYYAPNNAVMFVVGAVTPEEVFRARGQVPRHDPGAAAA